MAEPELYLFTGPEAGEKNDAIATIREAARKKHGDLDEYSYYAGDVRVIDVIAQLQNKSLFSSALFVVLKNAELLHVKADIEAIAAWAKTADKSENTLILVSSENSVEKKLEACVPQSHKKIFWEMFENRKEQWVRDYFRKNGFSVTPDAVGAILELIENNTEQLKAECSRFFYCFEKGHTVTEDDVDKILSHNREESAFTLFGAMADPSASPEKRLETSLGILQKIQQASNSSVATGLIGGLSYSFRLLRAWHTLHAKGASPTDAELRAAGLTGKKRIAQYQEASRVWSAGETSSIISLLSYTDMTCREDGRQLDTVHLFRLVYAIVIKKGLYCATYEKRQGI